MRESAAKYSEAHFDAKAVRYQAALNACPLARAFEILPFFFLLDHHMHRSAVSHCTLADLLCGSGYLTTYLRSCFGTVVGIDVSARMLDFYPVGGRVRAVKAAIESHPRVLEDLRPDAIVCLAGLHHVYVQEDGHVADELSHDIQADLLCEWASKLAPGGCMVVADVSDPRDGASFATQSAPLRSQVGQFSRQFESVWQAFRQYLGMTLGAASGQPSSIGQHAESVLTLAPTARRAQPGMWFREVVAKYGLYGHTDHFLRGALLQDRLRSAGFEARYYELPTPWAFPSQADFIYFFYEKFAIGPRARHVDEIDHAARDLIMNEADRCLGITTDAEGRVFSGWRLGYYVVTECSDRI